MAEAKTSSSGLTGMEKASVGVSAAGAVGEGVMAWYAAKKQEEQQKRDLKMQQQQLDETKRQFNVSSLMSLRKLRMDEKAGQQQLEIGQLEIEGAKSKMRSQQATLSAIARRMGGTNA